MRSVSLSLTPAWSRAICLASASVMVAPEEEEVAARVALGALAML